MSAEAARLREQAVEAARGGRVHDAAALHDRAVALAPSDASILNSAALFWSKQGEAERALALLRRAIDADSNNAEPLFNLCLILTGGGRADEALALLAAREPAMQGLARYWSIRGGAERALGRRRDALASYEVSARLDPTNAKASHGRARMALETGQSAVELYSPLVRAEPGNAEAWLGYAQALDADGRAGEARGVLETLVAKAPGWTEALEALARLRWASDEHDGFCNHYAAAVRQAPQAAVYASWSRTLAGVDRFAEAAEVAAAARIAFPDLEEFALIEAGHRGEAGEDMAADAIFAGLSAMTPERALHEARHRLRMGEADAAERLCAGVIEQLPDQVTAWALRGLAWRRLDDPRGQWLHGQDGLIRSIPLGLDRADLDRAIRYLDGLHESSAVPVGQSVRAGTQTRGGLFDRHEPEARRIETAFQEVIAAYRAALPARDDRHPLLRHRDHDWRIAGSWSVRLVDAGHHIQHIHPNGLISSAAYFAVPASAADGQAKAGWLELGRPPVGLRLDLEPEATIEPRVGECVLFPSTLYHGTRPFPAGKRMSVAIDINLARRE